MSEKPKCFGWVNTSREDLAMVQITTGDCKNCKFLGPCNAEYSQREYNQWQYEEPEENEQDEDTEEDDEIAYPGSGGPAPFRLEDEDEEDEEA